MKHFLTIDPQLRKVVCDFCRWETAEGDFSELEGRQAYDEEKEKEDALPILMRKRPTQPVPELVKDEGESEAVMETSLYHCKTCGARVSAPGRTCRVCGEPLVYEGRPDMM